jgi:hypothetical protein
MHPGQAGVETGAQVFADGHGFGVVVSHDLSSEFGDPILV